MGFVAKAQILHSPTSSFVFRIRVANMLPNCCLDNDPDELQTFIKLHNHRFGGIFALIFYIKYINCKMVILRQGDNSSFKDYVSMFCSLIKSRDAINNLYSEHRLCDNIFKLHYLI